MDFQERLQQFFLNQFKDGLNRSNLFIAFEPIGCMIDELDPDDPSTKINANEQLSILAERLPAIQPTMNFGTSRFSDLYETLVYGSSFRHDLFEDDEKEAYFKLFSLSKDQAIKKLEQGKRASVQTASGSYYLVTGYPDSWYNKNASIWINKSFKQKLTESSKENDDPVKFNLKWNLINKKRISPSMENKFNGVLQLKNIKQQPLIFQKKLNFPEKRNVPFKSINQIQQPVQNPTITLKTVPNIVQEPKKIQVHSLLSKRMELMQSVIKEKLVSEQHSEADSYEISFDYCLVNLHREWFDRSLFHYANLWYAKALEKDFFSNGMKDSSNLGELKCITSAMILVKNLKIKANWSQEDKSNASESLSLGFFNVAESEINNQNELINPGIQALGWICEVLPQLPKYSDPILFE